jgi:hypothetical protein
MTANRHHVLPPLEIEALHKGHGALPATRCQPVIAYVMPFFPVAGTPRRIFYIFSR